MPGPVPFSIFDADDVVAGTRRYDLYRVMFVASYTIVETLHRMEIPHA